MPARSRWNSCGGARVLWGRAVSARRKTRAWRAARDPESRLSPMLAVRSSSERSGGARNRRRLVLRVLPREFDAPRAIRTPQSASCWPKKQCYTAQGSWRYIAGIGAACAKAQPIIEPLLIKARRVICRTNKPIQWLGAARPAVRSANHFGSRGPDGGASEKLATAAK